MRIIIDIDDKNTRIINASVTNTQPIDKPRTLADEMEPYIGTQEYEGVVKTIQQWYYGKLVLAPWCATAISYFASKLGILDKIGGKNENVFVMLLACKCQPSKNGRFYTYEEVHQPFYIEKGDLLFWNWNAGHMTTTSSKHVGVASQDSSITSDNTSIPCLGGNQKDKICIINYLAKDLYAVYRPNYGGKNNGI